MSQGDKTVIGENENFVIYRLYDDHLDANYIDLVGILEGSKVVFLRSNFESIQESVALSNQFLGYIGLISVVIGIIAMLMISRKFTKPILEMAHIAKRMSELDFDAKYHVRKTTRLGSLVLVLIPCQINFRKPYWNLKEQIMSCRLIFRRKLKLMRYGIFV